MQKLLTTHILKFSVKALKATSLFLNGFSKRLDKLSVLTKNEKKILKRNLAFQNKHKDERAFIIVNGPSLKEQDISKLACENTFVVSGFYKHEIIGQWQPKYYCILDEYFFNGSGESTSFFKKLNDIITSSTFFIPLYRGYEANQQSKLLPEEKTFYIATAGLPSKNLDLTTVIQSFQSVSAFALAQAIYMGCNPIYLLGFDHDYLANRGMDRHFYTGGTIEGSPAATKTIGERFSYDYEMGSFLKLWKNYRSLDKIARKRGIKILNATKGGYLDVFQRINYEKIDFKS
jgi:hypothetical protein